MTERFAIYYADGSVYEGGGEGDELIDVTIRVSRDWLAAPADRVLGVIVENPQTGRVVLRGGEFFYPVEGSEYGFADDLGAWLHKLGGVVKRGEYVSTEVMGRMWAWAKRYVRIPKASQVQPDPAGDE